MKEEKGWIDGWMKGGREEEDFRSVQSHFNHVIIFLPLLMLVRGTRMDGGKD